MQKNTLLYPMPSTLLVDNDQGGKGYLPNEEQSLAKLICTGFIADKFYTTATEQMDTLEILAKKVSPQFLAACAIYSRHKGFLKDMPVVLMGLLRQRSLPLFKATFPKVVTDGRILRGLVGAIRSGKFGSKNLNHSGRELVKAWFNSRSPMEIWKQSIGNNPDLSSVMAWAHPDPGIDPQRQAVYKLLRKGEKLDSLPQEIKDFYAFVADQDMDMPKVGFDRLKSVSLSPDNWKKLGRDMTWTQLRKNLNTLERHGAWDDKSTDDDNYELKEVLTKKLTDSEEIKRAKVFPYEIYTSYLAVTNNSLKNALQEALDHSVANVPVLPSNTIIAVDVSGSMGAPINSTNRNIGLSCAQVSSLMATSIYKKNRNNVSMYTFDTTAREATNLLNPQDSIATNMGRLRFTGGGTSCEAPLNLVVNQNKPCNLFIMFSDNESWKNYSKYGKDSLSYIAWKLLKTKNPKAKFIMIDLAGSSTTQMPVDKDILHISGFSNNLFEAIGSWIENESLDFVAQIKNYK